MLRAELFFLPTFLEVLFGLVPFTCFLLFVQYFALSGSKEIHGTWPLMLLPCCGLLGSWA